MGQIEYRDDERYISFSQIETFQDCGWKWKLRYIDKIKKSNIFLVFGNSIHETIEILLTNPKKDEVVVFQTRWKENFHKFLNDAYILEETKKDKKKFLETCKNMFSSGPKLCRLAAESIKEKFPGWEILFVELPIKHKIDYVYEGKDNVFFILKIDLVLTDGNRIAVLDWKTSSWGWDAEKRNDKMKHYQLIYYKHFYSQMFEVPVDLIDCYFVLVKRTATKDIIEYIPVPGGPKKIKNSLKVLNNVLYNMENKKYIKNFGEACKFCPHKKTKNCPNS